MYLLQSSGSGSGRAAERKGICSRALGAALWAVELLPGLGEVEGLILLTGIRNLQCCEKEQRENAVTVRPK